MERKNWAKRIAALSTGALMLGATLTGALALGDLGMYPAQFVDPATNRLSDTVIVVGAAASTADVLGAVDIAASLQADAKSASGAGSSTEATTSEGIQIDKSGDRWNVAEDLFDVAPEALDDNDLPDLLATNEYSDDEGDNTQDEDYDQQIMFDNGNILFNLFTPEDGEGGYYLEITDGADLYNYTLEFDDAVTYDTSGSDDDFVGSKIEVLGKTYTITDTGVDGSGNLDSLTLVAGDSTVWLTQDQPLEFGGDTVTVVDVGNDGTKCGVDVNGHVEWIADGSTSDDFPSDLSIGVLEVVETSATGANACELSLGSAELVLEDGQEVSVNGVNVDGSEVQFTLDSAGEWTGFHVFYDVDVDVPTDDIYLAPGDAWTDPVFGSWKVHFAGVTGDYEELEWKSSGDDATLKFTNNDGKVVEIGWHHDGTNIGLGYDDAEPLLQPGERAVDAVLSSVNPEDVRFLYTTSGGEVHVLHLRKLDCTDSTKNSTDIYDETYGRYVAQNEELVEDCVGDADGETISLGSLGSITLNLTTTEVEFRSVAGQGDGTPESMYEGLLDFGDIYFNFTEDAGDEQSASSIYVNMSWDTADSEITRDSILDDGSGMTLVEKEDGDDDVKLGLTAKGTLVEVDTDEKLSLTISAPEEDAYASVFVTPLTATVSTTTSGGNAYNVHPFDVGLAVLDSDAESMDKNMIVVGGPCANTIASELMGDPDDCAAGFEEGKAMLKFFERGGNDALLVAGYGADDTRGAAYVLADHDEYGLSGSEVEVVSTNLANLKVNLV